MPGVGKGLLGLILLLLVVTRSFAGVYEDVKVSADCYRSQALCSKDDLVKQKILRACSKRPDLCDVKKNRLMAYRPNYSLFQVTDKDDNSIEAHYSFKYLFTKPHCMPLKLLNAGDGKKSVPEIDCLENYRNRWEAFFSYTGEFDFYAATRPSSPVINRISNPALHYRKYYRDVYWGDTALEWFNVSVEHRSNGQVISAKKTYNNPASPYYGQYIAQVELDSGGYEYFDSISRSANYLSLEGKFNTVGRDADDDDCSSRLSCFSFWVSSKLYFTDDSKVYWGKQANSGLRINDYDRVNLVLNKPFKSPLTAIPEMELGVEWVIGDQGLGTDSYDIHLMLPWIPANNLEIPFFIKAHFGAMNTLSNYTRKQNSIGIGFKLR